MGNMDLEAILQELAKYGRPALNQFSASATPGLAAGGTWNVEVSVSSTWPRGKELDVPVTGWRLYGRAATPTDAAAQCLEKCMALAESDMAPYAKFISAEMVRGK